MLRVGRIGRNGHQVEPHDGAFRRDDVADVVRVPGRPAAVARLQHVARPPHGQADLAVRQRVDLLGVVEAPDMGPDGREYGLGLRDHVRVPAVRILADERQHGRDHLVRLLQDVDPAVGEPGDHVRVEQHPPGVRGGGRVAFGDQPGVVGEPGGAPQVRHPVAVLRVPPPNLAHQVRVQVAAMGQPVLVERPEPAGQPLAGQERAVQHDDVVAAVPRQQRGFEGVARIEDVVHDPDAGLGLERRERARRDVVGPVVDADDRGLGGRGGGQQEHGRLGHDGDQERARSDGCLAWPGCACARGWRVPRM